MTNIATAADMPKFTFNNLSFQNDEEVAKYDQETSKSFVEKYFKPGQHEVVIESIEVKGRAKNDDTWVSLCVHLKGTGEKTIQGYIQVPTDDIKYGPKKTLFPYKNLQVFCAALGHPLSVATLKDTLKTVFGRPEKLVGRPVLIQVGYQKGYVKYAGKKEDGAKYFTLCDKDNNPVRDSVGAVVEFPDQAAAHAYAEENKIAVDKYVSVLTYARSTVAQPASAAATNW